MPQRPRERAKDGRVLNEGTGHRGGFVISLYKERFGHARGIGPRA